MAKRRSTERAAKEDGNGSASRPPNAGSNVGVRASIQRTAFRELWELDQEIAALKAQHIKPLQEERLEIWKTLRNDLDAQAADLKPLYSLYKRDREVKAFDDFDLAQRSQNMLREGWQTLAANQTLDFLSVLGSDAKGAGEAEHLDTKTARAAGREAGRTGKNANANPHSKESDLGAAWEEGRGEGLLENLPAAAVSAPDEAAH